MYKKIILLALNFTYLNGGVSYDWPLGETFPTRTWDNWTSFYYDLLYRRDRLFGLISSIERPDSVYRQQHAFFDPKFIALRRLKQDFEIVCLKLDLIHKYSESDLEIAIRDPKIQFLLVQKSLSKRE